MEFYSVLLRFFSGFVFWCLEFLGKAIRVCVVLVLCFAGVMGVFEELLRVVLLGLVQGFTEWLPVSSTAHLRLMDLFFGFLVSPFFNIVLHVGTLAVVVFFFRREVGRILVALVRFDFGSEYGRLVPRIAVAMVPTGVVGVLYVLFLQDCLQTVPVLGATFVVGASFVYCSRFGREDEAGWPSYRVAFLLGLAQGFAVFPGLSRSGVTISSALLLGLRREKAFKFSFLLSIPAVVGDFGVELYRDGGAFLSSGSGVLEVFAGVAVAVVAGYAALRLVSRLVMSRRFHYFAFYTWTLGFSLLALWLTGQI